MSFAAHLARSLEGLVPVSGDLAEVLGRHYDLLLSWNRRLNLTSITDLESAVERHYAESLFLAGQVTPGRILDIGSGAGFPGFPVAAFHPRATVTLLESDQRKAAFLREASDLLGNVRVICTRSDQLVEECDWLIARAVRLDDVLGPALRMATRIALLVGGSEKEQLRTHRRLSNVSASLLPWGEARWLVTGEVSRGTSDE
jgi:16S rRNA (guanine(527)-N(7))-methyltransferase RsmG